MEIVIADDSSLLRERIKNLLADSGKKLVVHEADNGLEALRLIRIKNPDLVILDIRMPEMNGIEVLKKLRELNLETRICILTNYPYPQYRTKCLELGADYFIDKNLEFQEIIRIIKKLNDIPNNSQND